jgi:hypothetical protein
MIETMSKGQDHFFSVAPAPYHQIPNATAGT